LFNESDGGGSQFRVDKTISYVGVNDGGENTSTGIFAQIYSKNISTNECARLNINPSGIYYGVCSSTPIDAAHELATKGDIPSVEGLITEQQLADAVEPKANSADVYSKTEADAKFITEHQDLSEYAKSSDVASADTSVLQNILGRIWTKKTPNPADGHFYTKLNTAKGYSLLFNESDGGGSQFRDDKTISYVGVNDGGENTSTGIFAQIYSKNISTNEGARLNINPSGMFYGVGASTPIDVAHELAVKGDIPSVEGLVTEQQLADAIEPKANTADVSSALDTKANSEDVVAKTDYDALKKRFDYLEKYVNDYLALTVEQLEQKNDEIIDTLSPDKKTVDILTPMESVVVPDAQDTAYTINVPLEEGSTVELTSNKYAYLNNTSEDAVSVSMGREIPGDEEPSKSNPTLYITGQYENITLENISLSQKDTQVNAVKNVTITENTSKSISMSIALQDGATITNNSDVSVTVNNQAVTPEDTSAASVAIIAPNSTVTIQGGKYNVLESTVGDNTLYINKAAHIDTLKVLRGNVIVNDYSVEDHIDYIINDTEYTVTPKTIEVYNKSDWSKVSSTPALYEVMNDIETPSRCAPGIFGSNARIKLNGHTLTCTDENAAFLLRGSSHFIIENGKIDATAYGIWLSGPGTVELKDVEVVASSHALYIEKPNGQFITSGNCRFSVKEEDTRYVANYLDSTYESGWTTGFHFGEGTEFVDFNPAESMSEPGGPVNLLDPGYHTESKEEDGHTIWTVVKDSE
jgi:hypothetical protein